METKRNKWNEAATNTVLEWLTDNGLGYEVNEALCSGRTAVDADGNGVDVECVEWDEALSATIARLRRALVKPE